MNADPDDCNEPDFPHWPGDWPGRRFVNLDCVGDPGDWLDLELSSVEEVLSADPQEDESTAEPLADAYIRAGRELAFPLPTDFGATDEEMREWAVADFVGFIREWRRRAQAAGCFNRESEQLQPAPSVDGGPGGDPAAAPIVSAAGTPTSSESHPGSVPKPPVTERRCGDLAGLTEEEFDKLFDEAFAASQAETTKQPGQKNTLSAEDIIAEFAKEGITGIDEAIKGLHDLFGSGLKSSESQLPTQQGSTEGKPAP